MPATALTASSRNFEDPAALWREREIKYNSSVPNVTKEEIL